MKKRTKEELQDLYYNDLKSFKEISVIYNCAASTIYNDFKKYGIKPRSLSEANTLLWTKERRDKKSKNMLGVKSNLGKRWKMDYKVNKNNSGDRNPMWKGGITPISKKLRNSYEYKTWRSAVYSRDNYTCQDCNKKDEVAGKLNCHHIIPFSTLLSVNKIKTYEDGISTLELWDINNGVTLCEPCHKKTDSYLKGGNIFKRKRNNKGQYTK